MTAKPDQYYNQYYPQHQDQQQYHYYQPKQQQQFPFHGKTPVYTLYPDILQKPSVAQIPPFSHKQFLPANHQKRSESSSSLNRNNSTRTAITITMGASYDTTSQSSFSSTKPSSHQHSHNHQQHRTDSNLGYSQQQQQQQEQQQKNSPRTGGHPTSSAKGIPASPILPSSPASMGYVTANKSTARMTKVDEAQSRSRAKTVGEGQPRYDQSQYQQPRTIPTVTPTTTAAAKEQSAPALSPRAHGQQTQAHYGGPVPRPRAASAAAQTHNAKSQGYGQGQQQHVQSQGQAYGQGQGQGLGTMKQSPPMGSGGFAPGSPSSPSSHSFTQNSRASPSSKTALSPPLPKQGSAASFSSLPSPTMSDKPSLLTVIPSASLALSFDQDSDLDYPHDQEKHQQQALEYQRRLQQKPPPKQGEDGSDDDSDSGSVMSYRRSIHRLSMTYKGRPGVPNISLFSSNQRSNVIHHDRSASGSSELSNSQMMIKDQREARLQHQQQQPPQQQQSQHQQHPHNYSARGNTNAGYTKQEPYGSGSSLASIDQRPRQEDGRPVMVRANTSQSPPSQRPRDIHIPERSSSADTLHYRSKSEGRPGQSTATTAYGQQTYHQHHPMPASPSLPSRYQMDPRPSHESSHSQRAYQQLDPRSSHESSQSQRPQHLQVSPISPRAGRAPGGYGPGPEPTRNGGPLSPGVNGGSSYSQNPGRSGGGGGGGGGNGGGNGGASHHPLPTSSRGPVGYGHGATAGPGGATGGVGGPIKLHPAHHLPSNGYVRPEEAFGPSNPMPEKAEDYVRQGIEFHEIGEISKATQYFRSAAEMGDPVGMLMYGLSVRHGWGCKANRQLAFQYLQKSAEHAVGDLKSTDSFASKAAKGELVLAIYELGI
ncbi:hypothetical protein BG015_003247, partial [Linnemannia schmuckeri]